MRQSLQDLTRLLALGLSASLLAYVGALSVPLAPWSALALPAGLAVAAHCRWSAWVHLPIIAGMLLGLWLARTGLALSLVSVGCASGAALLARWALTRMDFDPRLHRASDLAALTGSLTLIAALPAALLLSWWLSAASTNPPLQELATGWAVLSLCMLCTALAALALDRETLTLQRGSGWRASLASVMAVAVMLWALWLAPSAQSPLAPLAVFLPHVVVLVLVLYRHLAVAAGGLLMAALLTAGTATHGLSLWGDGGNVTAAVMAWMGSAMALLLVAHASLSNWENRNQRWEWALDGSRLGVADWHLSRQDSFVSAAWSVLTGQLPKNWDPVAWQRQVHVEDRAALSDAIAALSAGEAGRMQLELRMPRGDGWRWMEVTLLVVERSLTGHPQRLLATMDDVDERWQAQERQRMSASLFQHLHEGLLITDAELRVLDVNPTYCSILGVAREQVLGTVPTLLKPAPADPVERQQRAQMWAELRDSGSWRGELLESRPNGSLCTLQTTISTVRGPDNDLRYHVLVISDITQQQQQLELLERQAHFDELTRLPNRVRLGQLLAEALLSADRDAHLLVVCYLDLDHFKPVNDKFGHDAGDRLLCELAGRLRSALRSRDHWTDAAARLGGDEFVLLLRAETQDEARLAVERVLRVVAKPYVVDPAHEAVRVTASMGATIYPIDRSDPDTLLRHADHAMYGAKQTGRDGYRFFDPEQRRRSEEKALFIGRIQEGLDRQEFVLFYQPKVNMRSGEVVGFEALLRWDHPVEGLIAPLQFLPTIEQTGLSSRVGDWALAQALEHLAQWQRKGFDFSVSVNISARHLQEPDFAARLSELLARHPEPLAERLELEMLETAAHADIEAASALVKRCRQLGVRFALDDFGTGYSTLTYLKRLPVDVLKIDRSFVHHMLDDAQDKAIVEGVIGLARTFGCLVVAEGVESPAQARTLLELGCEIGQGTGIAAPMASAQVVQWTRDYKGMFALFPANPSLAGDTRPGGPGGATKLPDSQRS